MRVCLVLLTASLSACVTLTDFDRPIQGAADGGHAQDAMADSANDAHVSDVGIVDAENTDTGADAARLDAGMDAGSDAGMDAGSDAGADVPVVDAGPDVPAPTCDGGSLVSAGMDLQDAIDAAEIGDTLCVSGSRSGQFIINKDITLVASEGRSTELLGAGPGSVVTMSAGTLEGFTISGGGGAITNGGGLLVPSGATVMLRGTAITGNVLTMDNSFGAGVFVAAGGSLTLENVLVAENAIRSEGRVGGAGVATFGELIARNVSINTNSVELTGSGDFIFGSGVIVRGATATLVATNLAVLGNTSSIASAASQHWGTGMHVGRGATVDVTNGVIAGNAQLTLGDSIGVGVCVEESGGFPVVATFTNVINAFNTTVRPDEVGIAYFSNNNAEVSVRYSNTFDNYSTTADTGDDFSNVTPDAATSIFEDPLFVDMTSPQPGDWDVALGAGSTSIDAGDPAIRDVDTTRSDMGAYGGPGGGSW